VQTHSLSLKPYVVIYLKHMTIATTAIIADDEQHLSNFLRDRLAALWPELKVIALAANGPEALRLIDDHVPDIVFLDIRMPGLTGLEVAGRIDAKTRVVFVTAFDQYAVDAFDREAVHRAAKGPACRKRNAAGY